MARKATAQDVADLAGVSRSAVSLVLNGRAKGNISTTKQQAVLEAARRLEYSPNIVARGLRTSRTRILGALTWRGLGGLPLNLVGGAIQSSSSAGYLMVKLSAEPTDHAQRRALATLGNWQVDGVLVVAPELCAYVPVDSMSRTRTVLLNCVDPDQRLVSVAPDEEGAGFRAAQVLLDHGHRDIGLLRGPVGHHQTDLRARGVVRALASAGFRPAQVATASARIDEGCAAATALLTADQPPTALVSTNERLCVGALLAASVLGRSVPRDLSLVTFDDGEQLARELCPETTRVERPDALMSARAVELLIERLESPVPAGTRLYAFHCPVVDGASVVPPHR